MLFFFFPCFNRQRRITLLKTIDVGPEASGGPVPRRAASLCLSFVGVPGRKRRFSGLPGSRSPLLAKVPAWSAPYHYFSPFLASRFPFVAQRAPRDYEIVFQPIAAVPPFFFFFFFFFSIGFAALPHLWRRLVTEEEQPWPDNLAFDSLREAAAAFVALDIAPASDDLAVAVESVLQTLCRAIERCEDAGIAKREILAHLGAARAIHARSPFIARAQDWPRGYAGDFETIEYLCAAENRAPPGTMPHALEELALRGPITRQHRNKVAFQAEAILAACRRTSGRARILSIGCGGCRDIRSIANALPTATDFVLCDFDYEALDFALHALGPLAGRCTYLNATVPRVLRKLLRSAPSTWRLPAGCSTTCRTVGSR